MPTTRIPTHPGEILRLDFLKPSGMSIRSLATALHIPPMRLSLILRGKRAATADTALRLARYFSTTPQFWLNLQNAYDLARAVRSSGAAIRKAIHHYRSKLGQ